MVKNKEATMQHLLNTVDQLITEDGFEKVGINAIAARAGLSKMLIYRYFDSLEGLIAAYIKQHDYLINLTEEVPTKEDLPDFLKKMYHEQITLLRENYTLRRLYRWELSSDNKVVRQLREEREEKGKQLTAMVTQVSGLPHAAITMLGALLNSSITYLALLGEYCPYYNGILIQQDKGWEQIEESINQIIDHWIIKKER